MLTHYEAQLAISYSVIVVTKFLMSRISMLCEDAYRKLLSTCIFKFLNNSASGFWIDPDWYFFDALETGLENCESTMIEFINNN